MSDNSIPASLLADPELGARPRSAARGTILYKPGSPADDIFAIRQGQVRLYQLSPDGSRRLLEILGPGDWFGAEAVGGLSRYLCQAVAETASVLSVLPAGRMLGGRAQGRG